MRASELTRQIVLYLFVAGTAHAIMFYVFLNTRQINVRVYTSSLAHAHTAALARNNAMLVLLCCGALGPETRARTCLTKWGDIPNKK